MREYQLRVLDERCDLYKKIIKLKVYLKGTNYSVDLERQQYDIMKKYLEVLDKRIERFQ